MIDRMSLKIDFDVEYRSMTKSTSLNYYEKKKIKQKTIRKITKNCCLSITNDVESKRVYDVIEKFVMMKSLR